jgi:hypothetical protein
MTITASKLRNRSRRIDRINATVEGVLAAMKAGQCLHCEFGPRGSNWKLSNGRYVADAVARVIIANPSVVGDALWAGTTSQT